MNRKRIYFIRHGQTLDHESGTFQSYSSSLSVLGKKQIETVSNALSSGIFDCLVSSPMQRAKESAEIIQESLGLEVQYSDLFVESIRPSAIDGKDSSDETARVLQHQWKQTLVTTEDTRIEDGENYSDLVMRARQALEYLHAQEGSRIVVVTHGFFLRAMIACMIFGDSLDPHIMHKFQNYTQIDNGSISIVDRFLYEGEYIWHVQSMNSSPTSKKFTS